MGNKIFSRHPNSDNKERGQSIVLIAAAMIGLLAFVGIAVDVGFVFARNTQLQAAVDAAALAGVTELTSNNINLADDKAERFLNSNNIPITDTVAANAATMESSTYQTVIQETAYSLTVTWPVELFFLRVIGWDEVSLKKSATAAFFPLTDIYAGRRVEEGKLSTSTQGVFGPLACTGNGDPYSPFTSPFRPSGYPAGSYTYRYRILIPASYPDNMLRVELFDPDSYNSVNNDAEVVHSQYAVGSGFAAVENMDCVNDAQRGNQRHQYNPCLLVTDEDTLVDTTTGVSVDHINPYWYMRVDENRVGCNVPGSYTPNANTVTVYQLSYYSQGADGAIQKIPLASYTGLKDNSHSTDLHWVSPGSQASFDNVAVPVDAGSAKTFELNLDTDVPDLLAETGTGNRYLYLDVTTADGSSENGFEVWAGPNTYVNSVPSEANERNIHVLDSPGAHTSKGVTVFALGTLPMNSTTDNRVDVPLVYVSPNFAGETIYIKIFDSDTDTVSPMYFYFDSLSFNPEIPEGDWFMRFGPTSTGTAQMDGDGINSSTRCFPVCQNEWIDPSYKIIVPGDLENCDPNNPDPACTPFYGGRLTASYQGGAMDTFVWEITIPGPPYLVK